MKDFGDILKKVKCRVCGKYKYIGDFVTDKNSNMVCSFCSGIRKPIQIRKKVGNSKVKRTCENCNYLYNYDELTKKPVTCPYCDIEL